MDCWIRAVPSGGNGRRSTRRTEGHVARGVSAVQGRGGLSSESRPEAADGAPRQDGRTWRAHLSDRFELDV